MQTLPFFLALFWILPTYAQANSVALPAPPVAEIARMAPPSPPHHNPHPPKSAEDKLRVDFAVREIRAYYGTGVEIRHPHLIPWAMENFLRNRQNPVTPPAPDADVIVEAQAGAISREPPPHAGAAATGPALQADEYMVHVYARFQGDPVWYHLDVILTEDAAGRPQRRRFFRIPMPPAHGRLPPGVVC